VSWTRFGLVELDLLATHAGAAIPYPLKVPSFGRYPAERDALFAAASETLAFRGLADADGPTGIAADLVTALGRRRGTVDLVVRTPDGETAAVAIVYGRSALLCRQRDDDLVDVAKVHLSAVPGELTALVPELAGATTLPVQLPAAAARGAGTADPHTLVRDHGGDPDELDALTTLLTDVTAGGQLGATVTARNGEDSRSGTELCWLDTATGRVRVTMPPAEVDGWLSVNPLSPSTLHTAAVELTDALR
jgi:hypothetical protein